MKKILFVLSCVVFMILSFFMIKERAEAAYYTINANTTIQGYVAVEGAILADHNELIFNSLNRTVDPIINFSKGNSVIKEMGDLYFISDDYIHIGTTGPTTNAVLIQTPAEIASRARTGNGYLEAGTLQIKDINMTGSSEERTLSATHGTIDFFGSNVSFNDATVDFTDANVIGLTPEGPLLTQSDSEIQPDGGMDVNNGNFTVDPNGNVYITGNTVIGGNGTLTVNNTSYLHGGINTESGFILSPEGNMYTEGSVDFSAAVMTRIKNSPSVPACNTLKQGSLYFNTTDHNFYGCNGTSWIALGVNPN